MAVIIYFSLLRSKGILTVEGAWVLPVRMCNRRDAIPPISLYGSQIYSDCVSACVRFFLQYYMSLTASMWF